MDKVALVKELVPGDLLIGFDYVYVIVSIKQNRSLSAYKEPRHVIYYYVVYVNDFNTPALQWYSTDCSERVSNNETVFRYAKTD